MADGDGQCIRGVEKRMVQFGFEEGAQHFGHLLFGTAQDEWKNE